MNSEIDIRPILPSIRVPTLVLHRIGDRRVELGEARFIASAIPGARLVELPGEDHLPWVGEADAILDEVEEFVTGALGSVEPDRRLATLVFTLTSRARPTARSPWVTETGARYSLSTTPSSAESSSDTEATGSIRPVTVSSPPSTDLRAIRAAVASREAVRGLGLDIRAGVHTGEVEVMGNDLGGVAVHIGSRVMNQAGAGEVLVSSTVKDLVVGSGIEFADRGAYELKGVPGEWRLFAVAEG